MTRTISFPKADGTRTARLIFLQKGDAWYSPRPLFVSVLAGGAEAAITALRDGARGRTDAVAVDASPEDLKVLRDAGGLGGSASKASLIQVFWGCSVLALLPKVDATLLSLASAAASFSGIVPVPSQLPGSNGSDEDDLSDEDSDAGAAGASTFSQI